MAIKLTARQKEILTLIHQRMTDTGAPPTRAEIAAQLGFKSANAAEEHLQALARKGAIDLAVGTSRGIKLRFEQLREQFDFVLEQTSQRLHTVAQLALPLIGRVAAGSPVLAAEHVERTYFVESALFAAQPDYLLRVKGMSMRDAGILDGDLLAVKSAREAREGQIVVARLGEDVTVKRFSRRGSAVHLIAENPDFAPIIVQAHEALSIEGLAVGLIRDGGL